MSKVITFPCISGDIGKHTRNIIVMVADCEFSEIDKKCLCKNNIRPNDILLITTNDNDSQLCKVQENYDLKPYLNLSIEELFFEINKPKTIEEAKSEKYSMGEIVNIVDYSSKSIAHSSFMTTTTGSTTTGTTADPRCAFDPECCDAGKWIC